MGRDAHLFVRVTKKYESLPEDLSRKICSRWNSDELGAEGILVDISSVKSPTKKFTGIAQNRGHCASDVERFARDFLEREYKDRSFFVSAMTDDAADEIHFVCGPDAANLELRRGILHEKFESALIQNDLLDDSTFSRVFESVQLLRT